MLLQKLIARNPKFELYYDIIELFTGFSLVGFLWMHMVFVSTIVLGGDLYNRLAYFLDEYYLSYIFIPFLILIFFAHAIAAGRRIPTTYQEQKIILKHARSINETDTWVWVLQLVTAFAILVLASIHMWVVLTGWPITDTISAHRMDKFWLFYIILLFLGEYHAGFGIYRQFVKWGWFPRKPVGYVTKMITVIILGLGILALVTFLKLGGGM